MTTPLGRDCASCSRRSWSPISPVGVWSGEPLLAAVALGWTEGALLDAGAVWEDVVALGAEPVSDEPGLEHPETTTGIRQAKAIAGQFGA